MPLVGSRPPIQDEDVEGQAWAHTAIWGDAGLTMPGGSWKMPQKSGDPYDRMPKMRAGHLRIPKETWDKEHHKPKQGNFRRKKQRPSNLKYQ